MSSPRGKKLPAGYVSVGCPHVGEFRPQTDQGLRKTLVYLKNCATQKALHESETLLGWNAAALESSVPTLESWIGLDSLYFDQMHELEWGGRPRARALHTRLLDTGCTAATLRQWAGARTRRRTLPCALPTPCGSVIKITVEMHLRASWRCRCARPSAQRCYTRKRPCGSLSESPRALPRGVQDSRRQGAPRKLAAHGDAAS